MLDAKAKKEKKYAHEMYPAAISWLKSREYTHFHYEGCLSMKSHVRSLFDIVAGKVNPNGVINMVGIEVKSDRDSYSRLESQIPDYLFRDFLITLVPEPVAIL